MSGSRTEQKKVVCVRVIAFAGNDKPRPGTCSDGTESRKNVEKNKPFRRPSCQAREEKRKFSPTANSLRRRRQRSRT